MVQILEFLAELDKMLILGVGENQCVYLVLAFLLQHQVFEDLNEDVFANVVRYFQVFN